MSLDMNQAINQANAKTGKSHKDEAKQQFIVSDSTDKLSNPFHRRRDDGRDISEHSADCVSGSSLRTTLLSIKINGTYL